MQQFRVYYRIKGKTQSTVVKAPTSGEACDYVRDEYGPCSIIGVECL